MKYRTCRGGAIKKAEIKLCRAADDDVVFIAGRVYNHKGVLTALSKTGKIETIDLTLKVCYFPL